MIGGKEINKASHKVFRREPLGDFSDAFPGEIGIAATHLKNITVRYYLVKLNDSSQKIHKRRSLNMLKQPFDNVRLRLNEFEHLLHF
jgi:hypothetical protein